MQLEVAGHVAAFEADRRGQLGQAAVEPVDGPFERGPEGLVDHQLPQLGVGHQLHDEPRVPGGGAQLGQVPGAGAHQAGHPVAHVGGVAGRGEHLLAQRVHPVAVSAQDGPQQVGLGAEVVADGGVVALPRGLADLAVGHGEHAALREQPLRDGEDQLPGAAGPARAARSPAGRPAGHRHHPPVRGARAGAGVPYAWSPFAWSMVISLRRRRPEPVNAPCYLYVKRMT